MKTTIAYCSDLHLDFEKTLKLSKDFLLNTKKADILCLLGDTLELKNIDKFQDFFDIICENYEIVLYIYGNHEFYNNEITNAKQQLKKLTLHKENFIILDNDYIEYNDIIFIGSTLWTDMNNFNKEFCNNIKYLMNDYKMIRTLNKNGSHENLTVETTLSYHIKSVDFIDKTLKKFKDNPCVLLTHHAIHNNSGICKGGYQGAYSSNLSDIIRDNENLVVALHGHTHNPEYYEIEQCLIASNPKGYPKQLYKTTEEFKLKYLEFDY